MAVRPYSLLIVIVTKRLVNGLFAVTDFGLHPTIVLTQVLPLWLVVHANQLPKQGDLPPDF
jgi:hypothetical protein